MKPSASLWIVAVQVTLFVAFPLTKAELRGSSRQAQAAGEIVKLRLIDAAKDQPIAAYDPLPASSVIDVTALSTSFLNIEAITKGTIGSIQWNHNGYVRNEDSAPWALCGNKGSDFFQCHRIKMDANNTISATLYSGKNASGTVGPTVTIQLVLRSKANAVVQPPTLTLVNADTDEDIGPLVNGTIIDLSKTPTVNVRANPDPSVVTESVEFGFDGRLYRVENEAPYALQGNRDKDYLAGWTPAVGRHTIRVTAFAQDNGQGKPSSTVTISFDVISTVPTPTAPPLTAPTSKAPSRSVPTPIKTASPKVSTPSVNTATPTVVYPTAGPHVPTVSPTLPPNPPFAFEPTEPDTTPPELLDFVLLSPSIVDVSKGDVPVHFQIKIRDNGPNFFHATIEVNCVGPVGAGSARMVTNEWGFIPSPANTALTLNRTLIFPQYYFVSGDCALTVSFFDLSSMRTVANAAALAARNLPSRLTVVNSRGSVLSRVTALTNTTINLAAGKEAIVQLEVETLASYRPLLQFVGEAQLYPYETVLGPRNTAKHFFSIRFNGSRRDGDYPFGMLLEIRTYAQTNYFESADLKARGFPHKVTVKNN